MDKKPEIVSFEQAYERLQECVEKLSLETSSLDEIVALHEQCIAYHKECTDRLKEAKLRVEIYRAETDTMEEFGERL